MLALSALNPNTFMGLVTALSLFFSFGLTYFLLPTLLKFVDNTVEEPLALERVQNTREHEIELN